MSSQKIIPNLWFDHQAEEAAEFYISTFGDHSGINDRTYYTEAGQEIHGMAAGALMTVDFELAGFKITALNAGPHFQFTPAISFSVTCETEAEVDELWYKLSEGGSVVMPLKNYVWSEKYGWIKDKYGLTWQISLGRLEDVYGQKIIPSLMFVNEEGQAEEAINLYTSLFDNSSITGIMHYGPDEDQPEGHVMHAQFRLNSREVFTAMDSSPEHANFTFTEAVSLLVECKSQDEIDQLWAQLSADPQAEQCGWLKDKFGLSWQVVPKGMNEMMNADDPEKAKRVMNAMLQMKKLDIQKLQDAFEGKTSNSTQHVLKNKTKITLEATVKVPVETVWKLWTTPEDIVKWNSASDVWHTPKAENDLQPSGKFVFRMEAKDGSNGFDFSGVYDDVIQNKHIAYTLEDDRNVDIIFEDHGEETYITQTFEAESENSVEMQRDGWQAILNNFKKYAEHQFAGKI